MSSITNKLIEVQKQLVAPKSNFNNFGKYKYRSAEDILEAVKPLNAENGLLLVLKDKPILIGDWHYIEATASITDGTDTREVTAYARESESKKGMDHSQITGTASSYARKYALNGLYLIDDTKDADTDAYTQQSGSEEPKKKESTIKRASMTQQKEIENLAKEYIKIKGKGTLQMVYEHYKISDVKLITEKFAVETIDKLKTQVEVAKEDASKEKEKE